MADLDDFFAKKDKKKAKKKFTTSEEVAKKLEDNAKKPEKSTKKERTQDGDESGVPTHDQDEWKDFEEEKKDYSGLKIGNLTINANTDGNASGTETTSEQQPVYDDSGNEVEKKVGPWKRIASENTVEREPEKKPEPIAVSTGGIVQGGAYVPPSMRNQTQAQPLQASRLRTKTAPDIHNEEFFPTLSGGGGKSSDQRRNRNEGSFEVVAQHKSSSHRYAEQSKVSSGQGPKLNLGNRYNTLSNDS